MNIKDIEPKQIGELFVEWVQLERQYQEALKRLVVDNDMDTDEDDDRRKPTKPYSKKFDVETYTNLKDLGERQDKIYDKLYELADLYIAAKKI